MKVIKKNGVAVDFNPNKILNRIKKSSEGLNVNSDEIFLNVTQGIYDNITTKQLDELISNTASTFIPDNYDYSILSGRLLISRLHKEIPKDFLKVTKNLYKSDRIDKQYYDKCLLWGTEIEKYIDYDLDYNLDFFALGRFISIYLLSNKKTNEVFELPQHLFVRIAINRSNTLEDAIEDYLQLREFVSPATPIMLNSGTHIGQLASCELHSLNDDSREGIQISRNKSENASSKAAGIGLSIHNLRSKETELSTGGKAGGLIKFAKIINESMRFFDQGGNRPGACALYLEPWHKDIFDFLDLRKELGADEIRAKDIFLGLWTPDLFMKAVKEDKEWYLFCPNDIKKNNLRPLYELYGDEFEVEYNKAVELGIGKKIQAIDLWIKIYDSCVETGMPYIMYKDACNIKSNHKNIGTLKLSNLCTEILEYTDNETDAICSLTSFILNSFVKKDKENNLFFDFDKLYEVVYFQTKQMNNVIDINSYTNESGRKGGLEQRALGLGVQGLADTFFKMNFPSFTSDEARELNKRIYETIYFASLKASNDISKNKLLEYNYNDVSELPNDLLERVTYKYFKHSPISEGILQYDMWGKTKEVENNSKYNWKQLKKNIIKYGVHNSLLTTQMPTASSADARMSSSSMEPYTYNLYSRKVKDKNYTIINKYMQKELIELGWWNDWLKNEIIKNDGSVQKITALPKEFREKYKTVWEIKQKDLVQMSLDRAIFIDQAQSLNIFMIDPTLAKFTSCMFYSWENGSKNGSYYFHTQTITGDKNLGVSDNENIEQEIKTSNNGVECFNCGS